VLFGNLYILFLKFVIWNQWRSNCDVTVCFTFWCEEARAWNHEATAKSTTNRFGSFVTPYLLSLREAKSQQGTSLLLHLHDVSRDCCCTCTLHTCIMTSAYLRRLHLHYVIIAETAASALGHRRLLLHLHYVTGDCCCICMTSAETAAAPAWRQLHVFWKYFTCIPAYLRRLHLHAAHLHITLL
jgi:hypothetical protein